MEESTESKTENDTPDTLSKLMRSAIDFRCALPTFNIDGLRTFLESETIPQDTLREFFIFLLHQPWNRSIEMIEVFIQHGVIIDNTMFASFEGISLAVLRRLLVEPSVDHMKMDDAILQAIRIGHLSALRVYSEEFDIPLPPHELVQDALETLRSITTAEFYNEVTTFLCRTLSFLP